MRLDRFGAKVTEQTALFLLARCCARQDRPALAARLDDEVARLAARRAEMRSPAESFRQTLERDLSTLFMWKAVLDFGDLSVARPELLKEFKEVVRLFPESKHHERAAGYVEQLTAMVAEDQAHAAAARPIEKMTPEEQVREWIFRLRDQHGEQISQPGSCDIFIEDFLEGRGNIAGASPGAARPRRRAGAHRGAPRCPPDALRRLSPQLLFLAFRAHGRRLRRGHSLPHRRAAVPDRAHDLGRDAEGRRDGSRRARQVEAWWAKVRDKGEKAVLIENVSAGGRDSAEQAGRLAALDPAAAIAAIEAGLQAATEPWAKSNLVSVLASIKIGRGHGALRTTAPRFSQPGGSGGRRACGLSPRRAGGDPGHDRGVAEVAAGERR